jgi:hypothetical protein
MAGERTLVAKMADRPVNRSPRCTAQFLGISGAEPELENVRPVGDGGGSRIRAHGTLAVRPYFRVLAETLLHSNTWFWEPLPCRPLASISSEARSRVEEAAGKIALT